MERNGDGMTREKADPARRDPSAPGGDGDGSADDLLARRRRGVPPAIGAVEPEDDPGYGWGV